MRNGVLLTLGLLIATALHGAEREDTITREFTLAASGGARRVEIDNVFGPVTVRAGSSASEVKVEIRRRAEARHADDLETAFRDVTLAVREGPGGLELVQDGPFRCSERRHHGFGRTCDWDQEFELSWEWMVTVPVDVELEVRSVNGGAVEVSGVHGRIEAANVNGAVRLRDLVGAVEARTVNGGIEVAFARPPAAASSFESVNGEIELGLPRESSADIGLETMNGEMWSDFELVAVPQPARSAGGRRRFELGRDTVVRIGRGGVRLDCQTLNGDIVVRAL